MKEEEELENWGCTFCANCTYSYCLFSLYRAVREMNFIICLTVPVKMSTTTTKNGGGGGGGFIHGG